MISRLLKANVFFFFFLIVTSCFAQTDLPLLEEYNFQLGASGGNELLFHDPQLGNGLAQLRFHIQPISNQETQVRIEVFRHFISGVTFALLLERIEIQFVDGAGVTTKAIVLDKSLGQDGLFIIGDSNDGYFENVRKLTGMSAVRSVRLRLFGNYE